MSQTYLNVANYSNACEKVFEMNIDSLRNEIANFSNLSEIKGKRSVKDLDDLDNMIETIILLEASKKPTNTNFKDYQIASSFICKYS